MLTSSEAGSEDAGEGMATPSMKVREKVRWQVPKFIIVRRHSIVSYYKSDAGAQVEMLSLNSTLIDGHIFINPSVCLVVVPLTIMINRQQR